MEGENKPVKKPLSSASAIMNRHEKKRKKWYRNLLHGDSKKVDKEKMHKEAISKGVSRSLENVGQMNMSLLGIHEHTLSTSSFPRDEDSISVSSSESDTVDIFSSSCPEQRRQLWREQRFSSSDTEMTSENEFLDSATNGSDSSKRQSPVKKRDSEELSSVSDSGFSFLQNYLPLAFAPGASRGSSDSLLSQSEEKKTLAHLIEIATDSDQVSSLFASHLDKTFESFLFPIKNHYLVH